VFLNFLP